MTLLEVLTCTAVALLLYIALCAGAIVGRLSPASKHRSGNPRGQDVLDRTPVPPEQPPYGPVVIRDFQD